MKRTRNVVLRIRYNQLFDKEKERNRNKGYKIKRKKKRQEETRRQCKLELNEESKLEK